MARSMDAAASREAPASMLLAMALAAIACVVLAIVPGLMVPALSRVAGDLHLSEPLPGTGSGAADQLLALRVGAVPATLWPLWTAVGIVLLTLAIALAARMSGRARRRAAAWDCGDGPLSARMEYTATSFAEPLQRVFDDVLAPERDVDVTHVSESRYHVTAVTYQQRIPDRVENRLYRPLLAAVQAIGERARALANGSVHRYLGYMLTALLAVLIAGVLR